MLYYLLSRASVYHAANGAATLCGLTPITSVKALATSCRSDADYISGSISIGIALRTAERREMLSCPASVTLSHGCDFTTHIVPPHPFICVPRRCLPASRRDSKRAHSARIEDR